MAVDPTDPESFEEIEGFTDEESEDEQDGDAPLTGENTDRANEADLAEQARVVKLDEDEYR
ncbi:hypothetical protein [Streptomyces geranii]|uniref:hypothetical protein n=1 Tax=Streptomyces geranii TaxID=2058923 RepID=UPI000D0293D8|nr:hypothetical protein [Streptomyces geranii]